MLRRIYILCGLGVVAQVREEKKANPFENIMSSVRLCFGEDVDLSIRFSRILKGVANWEGKLKTKGMMELPGMTCSINGEKGAAITNIELYANKGVNKSLVVDPGFE